VRQLLSVFADPLRHQRPDIELDERHAQLGSGAQADRRLAAAGHADEQQPTWWIDAERASLVTEARLIAPDVLLHVVTAADQC
jgi:hypothetical protein